VKRPGPGQPDYAHAVWEQADLFMYLAWKAVGDDIGDQLIYIENQWAKEPERLIQDAVDISLKRLAGPMPDYAIDDGGIGL
jgi:hypothetical protein